MKRIVWSCVAMALGVLFVVAATFALLDDKVSCGGKTMSQSDVCVRESRSGTVVAEDTIDETRTSEKIGTFIGIGFGVLILVIGFQNLRIGLRNRKTATAQAQLDTAGPWQQHQQPQPDQHAWHQQQHAQPQQHNWQQQPQPGHAGQQPEHQGWQQPDQRHTPPSTHGGR